MEQTYLIQTEGFELTQWEFLTRMLVATGIGFVIGLEREYASRTKKRRLAAGVRTFTFVVLLGFLSTFLGLILTHWLIVVSFLGVIGIVCISYWVSASAGRIGGTTEFVTLLAFLLGCLTLVGLIEVSLALMVVVLVLLSLKVKLHGFIKRITQDELYAFVRFIVLALLLFPFLPDLYYGPYDVINPREIGWVIILTSGLGFVGYLLMKFWGSRKGILLTGLVGGLVSSTVVAWVFSKKSRVVPELSLSCAVAVLAASSIMVIRVFIWIFIFNQQLIPSLVAPLVLIFLAGLLSAVFFYRQQSLKKIQSEIPLGPPLNLREAAFFGILYTGVLLFVSYANSAFGKEGILVSSLIAALTDIDAITISVSKLAGDSVPMLTAQNAILLATMSNTFVKIGISLFFGSRDLRKYILIGFGSIFVAGLLGFYIMNS